MDEEDAEIQRAIAMSMELLGMPPETGDYSVTKGTEPSTDAKESQHVHRNGAAGRDEALAMILSVDDDNQLAETKKLLERIVLNVADHPGEAKYCTIRKDNRKIAVLLRTPGAYQFLTACGFVDDGMTLVMTDRNEGELRAAARSLGFLIDDQLAEMQEAGGVLRDDGSVPPQSSSHVPPRHFVCGKCRRVVSNDNSGGGWGASEGEFRYKCEHCPNFSLCCKCFDEWRERRLPHFEGHTFEHIPPYERYGWGSRGGSRPAPPPPSSRNVRGPWG